MEQKPQKRGPKPKIGPEEERKIYAILATGASIRDAADVLGIGRATINDHKRDTPKFRKGVDRAIASGKTRLIKKVGKAKPWQSAAWMLERKWGAEFGRRETIHQEHKVSGAISHEHRVQAAMGRLLSDPAAYQAAKDLAGRMSGVEVKPESNGNGNGHSH